ncbi:YbhB/YbcL family Raf kinase inhibitor-like protein [Rubrivivax gelatinosus]|nr:YbhB/YbcL family Raf kinase inhibitor-like protein [Rubrivivax gelatinosus]
MCALAAAPALAADFSVQLPDMADGRVATAQFANMPAMGCTGANVSPRVVWRDVPAGTQSLVVTMYDPDAPTGSGWWHWVVANIPASTNELPSGAGNDASKLPAGAVQINTDAGRPGYGGPCPPVGQTHRYVITVTALKVARLDLPPFATPAMLSFMSMPHRLGQAVFTARGGR